jgi:hypothetical protein
VTSEETLDCASNLPVQEKETLALPLSSSSSATKSASECGELKEKSVTSLMGPPQKKSEIDEVTTFEKKLKITHRKNDKKSYSD